MSELEQKVLLGSYQSVLVNVHRRPPGRQVVLHLSEAPAQDVHEQAADGGGGTAHAGVTVDVDGVSVL